MSDTRTDSSCEDEDMAAIEGGHGGICQGANEVSIANTAEFSGDKQEEGGTDESNVIQEIDEFMENISDNTVEDTDDNVLEYFEEDSMDFLEEDQEMKDNEPAPCEGEVQSQQIEDPDQHEEIEQPDHDFDNLKYTSSQLNEECLSDYLNKNSYELHRSKQPTLRQLKLRTVYFNHLMQLEKKEFGKPNPGIPEKIIMVVGATGAGKTTLINGMINYIFDVAWEDPERYILVQETNTRSQAYSQTQFITAYTINHRAGYNIPYTLTIIDTPGFGDTAGVFRDKQITEQIKRFFTTTDGFGIDHIDCICLVVQSSLPRLTHTQRYIFDHILALFGNDIGQNIYMMLTFADAKRPQVLNSLKAAGMPYEGFFKFNNSALYAQNASVQADSTDGDDDMEDESAFDQLFWKMGVLSFSKFMKKLEAMESKSLILTKTVLDERDKIQTHVHGIQAEIKVGLTKLEILEREMQLVEQHQAEIEANKNFVYYVDDIDIKQVQIPPGQYITNCIVCNRTCHQRCAISNDSEKAGCAAMTNGYCHVCPKKCHWSEHKNMSYEIVVNTVRVKKTYAELEERYRKAGEKRLSARDIIDKVSDEFIAKQLLVMSKTEEVRKSLDHLKKIALKPDPLSSLEYIDILIDAEKAECRTGWRERVGQLYKIRTEVLWMQDIAHKGHDPFKSYTDKIHKRAKSSLIQDALVSFGNTFKRKVLSFVGLE